MAVLVIMQLTVTGLPQVEESSQGASSKHISWWACVHGINYLSHNWGWITLV
jgi:hypothetical protein